MSLISHKLFQKICQDTGRTSLLEKGPLLCGISGKLVDVLGRTEIKTPELGLITYCVVKEIAYDCVIGYPELLEAIQ